MDFNLILTGVLLGLIVLFVLAIFYVLQLTRVPELPVVYPPPVKVEPVAPAPGPEVKGGIASIRNPHFGLQQAMTYAVKQADAGHSATLVRGVEGGPVVVSYKKDDHTASIHARAATQSEKRAGGDITIDTTYHPEPLVDGFDIYYVRQYRQRMTEADIAVEPGTVLAEAELEACIRAYEKHIAQLDVDAAKAAHADEEGEPREPRVSPAFFEF